MDHNPFSAHTTASDREPEDGGPDGGSTMFGVDAALAVAIALLAAVVGAWLSATFTRRQRGRIRVRSPRTAKGRAVGEFVDLYLERIEPGDRIPPDHITKFIGDRTCSVRTPAIFRWRRYVRTDPWGSQRPQHILLLAFHDGHVKGFLKAIYLPDVDALFIAYVGIDDQAELPNRVVMSALLNRLFKFGQHVHRVVYEVSDGSSNAAKQRLFRDYARIYMCDTRGAVVDYVHPQLATDLDLDQFGLATLLVAACPLEKGPCTEEPDDRKLVLSILKNVYLESFRRSEPQKYAEYEAYLAEVSELLELNPDSAASP